MTNVRNKLQAGTFVIVKKWEDIIPTLDENGALDGIPFQLEMRNYCGRRLQVLDNINRIIVEGSGMRSIENVLLLEGARCSGESHGGCRRRCILFFKSEWLEIDGEEDLSASQEPPVLDGELQPCHGQGCVLLQATKPLRYRYLRQYTKGINWPMFVFLSGRNSKWYMANMWRSLTGQKEAVSSRPSGLQKQESLSLAPGDLVKVKSKKEILSTLNRRSRYRGLAFVGSMLKYCGQTFRVLDRVTRLIDEKTGVMREISDAVILEDAICTGELYGGCPRRCYWLWREAWLEKV